MSISCPESIRIGEVLLTLNSGIISFDFSRILMLECFEVDLH